MGDFKSPGLIGRTFFNDGLQIRRNAWRWTYCTERLTVDLLFGTPGGGLTVRNAWRWTYCTERLAVDRARPANVRAPFSIRSS